MSETLGFVDLHCSSPVILHIGVFFFFLKLSRRLQSGGKNPSYFSIGVIQEKKILAGRLHTSSGTCHSLGYNLTLFNFLTMIMGQSGIVRCVLSFLHTYS